MDTKGNSSMGRMWHLYKMGGIAPALASMRGSPNAQQMAFIRRVSRELKNENTLDMPLDEMEAVVFDLETTGFYPDRGDEIISIGAVKIRGSAMEETETFYRLINPKRTIPKHIAELTGITNEMAEDGADLMDTLHDFLNFAGKRVLIAHGSGHDKTFLNAALWRTSKTHLTHRVLDTMMIAKWLEPKREEYGLDGLLDSFGVEVSTRHHALHDALMTAKLYFSFLNRIRKYPIVTLGDLYAYLSRH